MFSHVLFWQVRVNIIQSPYPFIPIENIEYNEDAPDHWDDNYKKDYRNENKK